MQNEKDEFESNSNKSQDPEAQNEFDDKDITKKQSLINQLNDVPTDTSLKSNKPKRSNKNLPNSNSTLDDNDYHYLDDSILDEFSNFDFNKMETEMEQILILNLHGIQQNLKGQPGGIQKYQNSIETVMNTFYPKSKYRQDIRYCQWKGQALKVFGDLIKATNTSNDTFFKYVGMELLFQNSNPVRAEEILNQIVAQMNVAYLDAKAKFGSKFKGKVILHAHSLGSYLSQEILKRQKQNIVYSKNKQKFDPCHCRQRLLFDFEQFYSLGGVIGLFYSLKQECVGMEQLGKVKKWFNIYQVKDPVATRVEPLMAEYKNKVEAAWMLPNPFKYKGVEDSENLQIFIDDIYKKFDDKQRVKAEIDQQIQDKTKKEKRHTQDDNVHLTDQKSTKTPKEGSIIELDVHQNQRNTRKKQDFILQENMSSYLVKPLAQFGGHFGYWTNLDFQYFMHSNIEGMPITDTSKKNKGMIIGGVWYEV